MKVRGCTALVTGSNRGIGKALVEGLLAAGAAKVYAAARNPGSVSTAGAVPVQLDITRPQDVADIATRCSDVTLLINNAGVGRLSTLMGAPDLDEARHTMETNYFGTLAMCRAFAPVLKANGGGAIVNVLSVASWYAPAPIGAYASSKAAASSMTRSIRIELRAQGTLVMAVHPGPTETDMGRQLKVPMVSPATTVAAIIDALETGTEDVMPDPRSVQVCAGYLRESAVMQAQLQEAWDKGSAVPIAMKEPVSTGS